MLQCCLWQKQNRKQAERTVWFYLNVLTMAENNVITAVLIRQRVAVNIICYSSLEKKN